MQKRHDNGALQDTPAARSGRDQGGLRAETLYQTLLCSVLPIVLAGSVVLFILNYQLDVIETSFAQSRTTLTDDLVGENLKIQAALTAHQIDAFLIERIAEAKAWASSSIVIKAARDGHARHSAEGLVGLSIENIEAQFRTRKSLGAAPEADTYLRQQMDSSSHFAEIFFTDRNGFNVAVTNPTSDFVQSDEGWWQGAWSHGLSVSEIGYDESAGVWSVDISVRINVSDSGEPVGVMKTVLAIDSVQRIADRTAEALPGGVTQVATVRGVLIADTSSDHARERVMNPDVNLIEGGTSSVRAAFEGERSGFSSDGQWVTGYAHSGERNLYVAATRSFSGLDWVVILQSPVSRIHSLITSLGEIKNALQDWRNLLAFSLGAMAIVSAVITIIFAGVAARRLLSSLHSMQDMAEHAIRGEDAPVARIEHPRELARLNEAVRRLSQICVIVIRRRNQRRQS